MRMLKRLTVAGLFALALASPSAVFAGEVTGRSVQTGNLGNPNNISVQTNIEGTKTIDSSSTISVNQVINGVNVGYGLSGANVLNVIDSAVNSDASITGARTSAAVTLEDDVLSAVQVPQGN